MTEMCVNSLIEQSEYLSDTDIRSVSSELSIGLIPKDVQMNVSTGTTGTCCTDVMLRLSLDQDVCIQTLILRLVCHTILL